MAALLGSEIDLKHKKGRQPIGMLYSKRYPGVGYHTVRKNDSANKIFVYDTRSVQAMLSPLLTVVVGSGNLYIHDPETSQLVYKCTKIEEVMRFAYELITKQRKLDVKCYPPQS